MLAEAHHALAQYFHASMVVFFLRRSLINERLARSMRGDQETVFRVQWNMLILLIGLSLLCTISAVSRESGDHPDVGNQLKTERHRTP